MISREGILDKILKTLEKLYEEFKESDYFNELTDLQKAYSANVIEFVTKYMYDYFSAPPQKWNASNLVSCLLNIVPSKVTGELPLFESVVPVLTAFLKFLSRKGILRNIKKILSSIEAINRDLIKNAKDPDKWDLGKRILMIGLAFEVDPFDKKRLDKLIILYNLLNVRVLP